MGVATTSGALAWLAWRALAGPLRATIVSRAERSRGVLWLALNYADRPVLTPSGMVVVGLGAAVALVLAALAAAGWWFAGDADGTSLRVDVSLATFALTVGFGVLGYADDRASEANEPRGLRGHLRALLAHGVVTAGLAKAVGGLAVGLFVVTLAAGTPDVGAQVGSVGAADGLDDIAVGALLVALFANFVNLCDTAPGRAAKVSLAAWLAVLIGAAAASTSASAALLAAPAVGATAGLLRAELTEEHMLGDTGANVLGAVLGFAVVLAAPPPVELAVVVALVALTLASEFVPFSRVIAAVRPLRWLDALGAKHHC